MAEKGCFQPLNYGVFPLFSLLYDIKLNIFGFRYDKTRQDTTLDFKKLGWAFFTILFSDILQGLIEKIIGRLIHKENNR